MDALQVHLDRMHLRDIMRTFPRMVPSGWSRLVNAPVRDDEGRYVMAYSSTRLVVVHYMVEGCEYHALHLKRPQYLRRLPIGQVPNLELTEDDYDRVKRLYRKVPLVFPPTSSPWRAVGGTGILECKHEVLLA